MKIEYKEKNVGGKTITKKSVLKKAKPKNLVVPIESLEISIHRVYEKWMLVMKEQIPAEEWTEAVKENTRKVMDSHFDILFDDDNHTIVVTVSRENQQDIFNYLAMEFFSHSQVGYLRLIDIFYQMKTAAQRE